MNIKVYVDVDVEIRQDGYMTPKSLLWEDGTRYIIDKVMDTIIINGKQSYLFFERSANLSGNVIGRWFVERNVA